MQAGLHFCCAHMAKCIPKTGTPGIEKVNVGSG